MEQKPTTGRMITTEPELQFLPKGEVYTDPLLPPGVVELRSGGRFVRGDLDTGEITEGKIVEMDFSEIELRITAHLTNSAK